MKRLTLSLAALAAAGCQERSETPPSAVTSEIRAYAAAQCGVSPDAARFEPGYLQVVDLSKDKRPDYVVDYAAIRCGGDRSLLCGEDGCLREVYVSDGRGGYGVAFEHIVRGFTLDLEARPPAIAATLAGEACRKALGVRPQDPHPVCEKGFVFDPIQLIFIEQAPAAPPAATPETAVGTG